LALGTGLRGEERVPPKYGNGMEGNVEKKGGRARRKKEPVIVEQSEGVHKTIGLLQGGY